MLPLNSGWSLASAFRSPATAAGSLQPPFRGQRSRPDASPTSRTGLHARSALRLHYRCCSEGLPPATAASSPQARCASSRTVPPTATCDLHSPSGVLPPSRSKRSTALAAGQPTWRFRPFASRSPPPYLFLVSAADHRSWLASDPPASCSSNLLEPHSL